MADIKWEDPPESNRGKDHELADALRKNPGKWAIAREHAWGSVLTGMRKGDYASFRPITEFEFRFKSDPNSKNRQQGTIYARFIGLPFDGD